MASGPALNGKGQQVVPVGDRLVLQMPGGGGYGDPLASDMDAIRRDIDGGLITLEAAARDYPQCRG